MINSRKIENSKVHGLNFLYVVFGNYCKFSVLEFVDIFYFCEFEIYVKNTQATSGALSTITSFRKRSLTVYVDQQSEKYLIYVNFKHNMK